MKTFTLLTVSAAALLYAGTASAQSYPYGVSPTQATANVATSVDQKGDGNSAAVSQRASGTTDQNTTVIVQGFDGVNANQSSANVSQAGSGQRALIMQTNSNTASTTQSGANNDAFTYQTGSSNTANIAQSGTSSPAHTGNIGGVNGVGSVGGGDTLASTFANASEADLENSANTTGLGSPADPLNESAAYIVQASGAASNNAAVNQSAAGERAVIVQIGFENNSTAGIVQSGNATDAFVHQDTGAFNSGSVNQSGSYQTAGVYQSGSISGTASISQSDFGHVGYALQTGASNQSYITQSGAVGRNQARTIQSGNNGLSYVTQTGSNSTGSVTQVGGTNNTSYLTQTNDADVADVTQTGSYNTSSIGQTTDSAWAHVGQTGVGNSVTISQGH